MSLIAEREIDQKILQNLLENSRTTRTNQLPYASPVIVDRKKKGEPRHADDQIDRLSESKYYTTLDISSGFHEIKARPDSVEKVTFITRRSVRIVTNFIFPCK